MSLPRHLCKADFHLADEEAAFIAENLDIPFTTEEMNTYIRTHRTESHDFAKKIPTSFARLVAYDRAQAAALSDIVDTLTWEVELNAPAE